MLTSLIVTIQEFGVFKTLCTVAVGAFFVWIFVRKGNNGGGKSGGSSTPPAQG